MSRAYMRMCVYDRNMINNKYPNSIKVKLIDYIDSVVKYFSLRGEELSKVSFISIFIFEYK